MREITAYYIKDTCGLRSCITGITIYLAGSEPGETQVSARSLRTKRSNTWVRTGNTHSGYQPPLSSLLGSGGPSLIDRSEACDQMARVCLVKGINLGFSFVLLLGVVCAVIPAQFKLTCIETPHNSNTKTPKCFLSPQCKKKTCMIQTA